MEQQPGERFFFSYRTWCAYVSGFYTNDAREPHYAPLYKHQTGKRENMYA
jgi:hypothetical protein